MILRALVVLAIVAATALLPYVASGYVVSVAIQLFMFMALAYSWNVIGGYAGYPHFGQVGFFGIGAYVTAILVGTGWHWASAALASALSAAALAVLLGATLLHLRGPFFAIGMFGLSRIFEAVAFSWGDLTGGGTGLFLPPVSDLTLIYFAFAAIALGMLALTWHIDRSRFGLKLLAIREDEVAAEAFGLRTTRLKITAFAISALAPGACGGLYGVYLSYIDPPTAFGVNVDLTTIAMVLLGGMGTLFGPLIGAIVLGILNEVLWANLPEVYLAVTGLCIIVAVMFMPRGIIDLAIRRGWLRRDRLSMRRAAPDRTRP